MKYQAFIFSAIVITFAAQTYQSLQQDPQAISATLLLELITVQRAVANGSSINDVPSASSPFTLSSSDVWIDSLCFTSLTMSLLTAFLGLLAKQWLYQYVSTTFGPPRTRALIRQARNLCLHEWHVPTLIGVLPVILHVSLALFFAGLIILLYSLLSSLAYFVAAGIVYTAYFISNFLPVFFPRSPYRTGLTPMLYHLSISLPIPHLNLSPHAEKDVMDPAFERVYLSAGHGFVS